MNLDLETFLTTLYVLTDDLYESEIRKRMPSTSGPAPKLSDSEVLCLGLAAQWHRGVPWQSERAFVRYALAHLRSYFPGMTTQSAFNRRLRRLWGAFWWLQQVLVGRLAAAPSCEIVDSVPVRVAHGARRFKPGWLAGIAQAGKGGTDGFFYGLRLLVAITPDGLVTGWTMGAGNVQEHWLLELLLSTRRGQPQLGRIPSSKKDGPPRPPDPCEPIWCWPTAASAARTGKAIGRNSTTWPSRPRIPGQPVDCGVGSMQYAMMLRPLLPISIPFLTWSAPTRTRRGAS